MISGNGEKLGSGRKTVGLCMQPQGRFRYQAILWRPSRPISRVLFPGTRPGGGHLSRTAVARRLQQPTRKSTGASNSRPSVANHVRISFCLALLPVGDAWPTVSPRPPVRSYRTVSPSPTSHPARGMQARQYTSLLPCSAGSLRLAVSQHCALWSPDFPHPRIPLAGD